ncbi:hypothetical protein ACJMK2_007368 [Sinanodonta woodiana]|uniref:Alanine--glyoxylate aminotransferase n=1 Tax=Sinanodonta woodiana TaxID=1069815 RepID=A0ABD3VIC3_SINWO
MAKVSPPPECLFKPMNFPQKVLMGPGPSNCPPRVLAASALPMLGPTHPEFTLIMDEVKAGIKYIFQTNNEWTVCVTGSGHAAMETACLNLLEPGDTALVGINGLWGERFAEMVHRQGIDVKTLHRPTGEVFTFEEIEEALKKHKPTLLSLTHGESTGGTLQPLEGIGSLCHKYNCLLLVDSIASCGGVPLFMDLWGIDCLYTGAQKVLSAPSGASPISFSKRAKEKVKKRLTEVRSLYFDMNHLANYWGCDGEARRYHHTGPTSCIYAIRESLAVLAEQGLEESWKKHKHCAELLYEGLEKIGLELLVKDKSIRNPCVTVVKVPDGVDWKSVIEYTRKTYRVEIGSGLGVLVGKVWRIGLMGYNCTPDNVRLVLRVLEEALRVTRTARL